MNIRERLGQYEHEVHDELRMLAEPHVQAIPMFEMLETKPDEYPAQSLVTRRIEGSPAGSAIVEMVASGIEPRFHQFTDKLEKQEQEHQEISRMGELLKDNQNIILVTNHGDIKDIAFTLAAYYSKLKERHYEFHSSLVMSKIISFIGINMGDKVEPVVDILRLICDDEYFSFPRTKSISESRLAGPIVDGYNKSVRRSMEKRLEKGRNLFAIAASGTTDKPLKDDHNTISMGPVGRGTAKLMMTPNSLVVPIAVWVTDDELHFQPCGIPRKVTSHQDADGVMQTIASYLNANVEGKNFVYQPDTTIKDIGRLAVEE